jgi:radical SAM protein with 4Fe4S-binding SPASM domain
MAARKSLAGKCWEAVKTLATRRIEFTFENLPVVIPNASYGRIANWLLAETAVILKPSRPLGSPTHVQIETSTKCNQRCQYCPVGQETAEATGHLEMETFRRFTDSLGDKPLIFQLWGWGEPFLNTSIYDMIRYARSRDIRTISSTNGELFARMDHAENLVASGLDMLIVAISGITQETYGEFRPGSQMARVFDGIRNIVQAKRRQGKQTPLISLTFVVSESNEQEIPQLHAKAKELGVDALTIKKLNPASTESERWQGDQHVARNPNLVRLKYKDGQRVRVKHNRCKALWQGTTLRWDGRINPCAYDFHGKQTLGHLGQNDFVQIWSGPAYQTMRQQFRKDWNQISICENCTYAFEGGSYDEVFADTVIFGAGA